MHLSTTELALELEKVCPVCGKRFPTPKGAAAHLRMAKSCRGQAKKKMVEDEVNRDREFFPVKHTVNEATGSSTTIDSTYETEWDGPTDADDAAANEELFFFVPVDAIAPVEGEAGPSSEGSYHLPNTSSPLAPDDADELVIQENLSHGRIIRMSPNLHDLWKKHFDQDKKEDGQMDVDMVDAEATDYYPFQSLRDWQVAKWAITDDIGHSSLDRLLALPGVPESLGISFKTIAELHSTLKRIPERVEWKKKNIIFEDSPDEKHEVRFRDPLQAIAALWSEPSLSKHLMYRPRKVWKDNKKKTRIYNEMCTGLWWEAVQASLPDGSTVAPVIIATDKTHLTQLSGNLVAYPVYLSLGNIPKALRQRPSLNGCILIGYLPVSKVDPQKLSKQEIKCRGQRLFHAAMRMILKPLIEAGSNGLLLSNAEGEVRRVHPILASYVADYPEQVFVTCSKSGVCPKCQCSNDELGNATAGTPRTHDSTLKIINDAKTRATTRREFFALCQAEDVMGGVTEPFWSGFPLANIHLSITPDILHQLYQGVINHLINWCKILLSKAELDNRIKALPPYWGLRHFKKGISGLTQVTGKERKAIAAVLLSCVAGRLHPQGLQACRAILDFTYLARYTSHDDITLGYMKDALNMWHKNRQYFITERARKKKDFNIPKFHSMLHYVESIQRFGTADNYNTEMFERLHIDFAKDGYRASNKRDVFDQMQGYLTRKERISRFTSYLEGFPHYEPDEPDKPRAGIVNATGQYVKLAKKAPQKDIQKIKADHDIPQLQEDLGVYLRQNAFPNGDGANRKERSMAKQLELPFTSLGVLYQLKLHSSSPTSDFDADEDPIPFKGQTIKAKPSTTTQPAQFDPIIVLDSDEGEQSGLEGTRVARLRLIFELPNKIEGEAAPSSWAGRRLAYIEYYTKPDRSKASTASHNFWRVKRSPQKDRKFAIIPLSRIHQACQLIPSFTSSPVPKDVNSTNILDSQYYDTFHINNWADVFSYQTIW